MKEVLEENETVKSSLIFKQKSELQPAFERVGRQEKQPLIPTLLLS